MSAQSPAARSAPRVLEVDAGQFAPVAFGSLRKVFAVLQDHAPSIFAEHLRRRPAEWSRLLPGSVQGAPDLSDLALSPSERRLHKESEQVFRILNAGASLMVEVLRDTGCTLRVLNVGEADLVSLRGLVRAAEWAGLEGVAEGLQLSGFGARRHHASAWFEPRRREYLDALRRRLRLPLQERPDGPEARRSPEAPVDHEGRYLHAVLDEQADPARRIAAALLTTRTCFFSTNEEGTLLASEKALGLLDTYGAGLSLSGIQRAWDDLDQGFSNAAVELDRGDLEDLETIRGILLRRAGVAHAYTDEFPLALRRFAQGSELNLRPERRAELMNYHAICAIKRVKDADAGLAELKAAYALIADRTTPEARLQRAWLHNGLALVYWNRGQLDLAFNEVNQAAALAGDLHGPAATHAKINLLSNISVLQETAKRYDAAVETWSKFERVSRGWGANFDKHYRYRLGGLSLKQGDTSGSLAQYAEAFAKTRELQDDFYAHRIALELGTHRLRAGEKEAAALWFGEALQSARELGEPLGIAQAMAGTVLARGGSDFSEATAPLRASTTYAAAAASLQQALDAGRPEGIAAHLPSPRSKLNLPYAPVNL